MSSIDGPANKAIVQVQGNYSTPTFWLDKKKM